MCKEKEEKKRRRKERALFHKRSLYFRGTESPKEEGKLESGGNFLPLSASKKGSSKTTSCRGGSSRFRKGRLHPRGLPP